MSFHANLRWPYDRDDGTVVEKWVDGTVEPLCANGKKAKFRLTFPCETVFVVSRKKLSQVPYIVKAKGPMGQPRFAHLKLETPWPLQQAGANRAEQRLWSDGLCQGADSAREIVLGYAHKLDARNVSVAAHRLAKYGISDDTCWEKVLARMRAVHLKGYNAQCLGNILWALGKAYRIESCDVVALAHVRAKELLAASAADSVLEPFKPQEVANMLLGATKLDMLDVEFSCEIASRCVADQWKGFSPQEMTNVLWALTRGGYASPYVVANVVKKAAKNMTMFKPAELCNIVWAVAKTQLPNGKEFVQQVVTYAATQNLSGYNPQDVSNLMWAVATLEMEVSNEFLSKAAKHATSLATQFSGIDAAGLLWAFANLCFYDRKLLRALSEHMVAMKDLPAQAVSNFAFALAKLAFYHPVIHNLSSRALQWKDGTFTPQNMANVIYACALLGTLKDDKELMQITEELLQSAKKRDVEFGAKQRSQCAVAHQCLFRGEQACPPRWRKALLKGHSQDVGERLESRSVFHKQVSETIENLGYNVTNEEIMDDFFVVDIVVQAKKRKIFVEVDGPYHFLAYDGKCANESERANGPTLLKRKLMEARGYCVKSISYPTWYGDNPVCIKTLLDEGEPTAKRRKLNKKT